MQGMGNTNVNEETKKPKKIGVGSGSQSGTSVTSSASGGSGASSGTFSLTGTGGSKTAVSENSAGNSGLDTGLNRELVQPDVELLPDVEEMKAPEVPTEWGVRNMLENEFRVNGENIGYDGEYVTLNGQRIVKPDENRDGTTYVKDREAIINGISEYAKNNGMVAIRDYVTNKGLPVDVEWRGADGTVSINGQTVKPAYVIDGKAYVPQSQIDAVIERVHEDNGMRKDTDVLADSMNRYGDDIDASYQNYMNYDDFKWNPEQDASYQNFMDMYRRSVNDEYAANMAQANFRTGGVMSPAAMQAAANVRSRAMADAAQYAQQYEDRAYGRWGDSRAQAADELSTAWGMAQNDYNLQSGANRNNINDWYDNQRWQDENYRNHLDYRTSDIDYRDRVLESDMYQAFGPGIAYDEAVTSRAGANDAILASGVNRTYAYDNAAADNQGKWLANDATRADIDATYADIANTEADTAATRDANARANAEAQVNLAGAVQSGINQAAQNGTTYPLSIPEGWDPTAWYSYLSSL